jgi:hypothetical protein
MSEIKDGLEDAGESMKRGYKENRTQNGRRC